MSNRIAYKFTFVHINMSTPYDRAFFSSFLRLNFVVLFLGVHPERCAERQIKTCRQLLPLLRQPACPTWRFVLIRHMAPLNLHTLSVCHTRGPCLYSFVLKCHLHPPVVNTESYRKISKATEINRKLSKATESYTES